MLRRMVVSWSAGGLLQRSGSLIILVLVVSLSALPQSNHVRRVREWRSYGHDPGGMRFSQLKQITRSNVSRLKRVWTYHTGEVNAQMRSREGSRVVAFECTPLMIGDVLYFSTAAHRVIALNAETGVEIWKFDPQVGRTAPRWHEPSRGVSYWEGPSATGHGIDQRILFTTADARLVALDARTGKPCPGFGKNGAINLRHGVADRWPDLEFSVTSPAVIYKDLVIVGSTVQEYPSRGPSGAVRAFNVRTGRLVWKFDTVPGPGQVGHETWKGDSWKDRSGTNAWSMMSLDARRGIVFLPLGSPSYDFYGADRKGKDLFGNSLVALNARTGKLLWYYQMVHHDLWDYDLPAQPVLVTVRREGREIPAVAQVTKMGFVFVLNRVTGKPLFPVEERSVPASKVPGESAWPTQPFPLMPPPLARISLTRKDITDVTPESHRYCEKTFGAFLPAHIFTPWGQNLTIDIPGTLGGGTWAGGAFDPSNSYFYVNVNELGAVGMMKPQPVGSPEPFRRASPWGAYARFWDPNHYPCQKPPWGTLNAINLNTGQLVWKVPLGVVDKLLSKGIPPTGTPNIGGPIVTAGGLVFIAGSSDSQFRAFDAQTGKQLWVTRLEASGYATPMTFMGEKTGKQFVVIAAGGGGYFSSKVSDTLDAFALPDH
ncbi:MAG: pyrroloquinoline quinone-dependent dehydrogenase [Terriglobia bacterium]